MTTPVQITFRGMDRSDALEERIRTLAARLDRYFERIVSCRVVVEARHHHHQKGNIYHVRIDLTVPEAELVVGHDSAARHAHEDVYVALRDAFDAMRRRLEDHARRLRGAVKRHEAPACGRIRELMPAAGYGLIVTADGREIPFWRASVADAEFDRLRAGDAVRFTEAAGADGPVASTVHRTGADAVPD